MKLLLWIFFLFVAAEGQSVSTTVVVTNLREIGARQNSIFLAWDAPRINNAFEKVEKYQIGILSQNITNPETKNSFLNIYGLEPSSTYTFYVRVVTNFGTSRNISDVITATTCPPNLLRNSGESTECIAAAGFFKNVKGEAESCEDGILPLALVPNSCSVEGLTVQNLRFRIGWWRPNISEVEPRECPQPLFCEQNNSLAEIPMDRLCSSFHEGTFCSSCEKGFALSRFTGCLECDDNTRRDHRNRAIIYVVVVCILAVLVLFGSSLLRRKTMHLPCKTASESSHNCWKIPVDVLLKISRLSTEKIRILLGFFQVLFVFQSNLYLYVNQEGASSVEFLESMFNLNLEPVASALEISCFFDYDHYHVLLVYTLLPIILISIVMLKTKISIKFFPLEKKRLQGEETNFVFVVTFLVYPGVSRVIFDTFNCDEFDTIMKDTESNFKRALRVDPRLNCNSTASDRIGWITYASFMVLVYPVGILCLYIFFLRRVKLIQMKAKKSDTDKDMLQRLRLLIQPYKENRYWFEAYELIRKLVMTTVITFVFVLFQETDSSNQRVVTYVAQHMCILAVFILLIVNPYKHVMNYYFAVFSLILLIPSTQFNQYIDIQDEQCDLLCIGRKIRKGFNWLIGIELSAFVSFVLADYYLRNRKAENSVDSKCVQESNSLFKEDGQGEFPEVRNATNPVVDADQNEIAFLHSHILNVMADNAKLRKENSHLKAELSSFVEESCTTERDTTFHPDILRLHVN